MHKNIKLTLVAVTALCLFSIILLTFWFQDWQYSLPTPKPPRLLQPATGKALLLESLAPHSRPFFLHFYNPACPCSRFNLDHVRRLVHQYGTRVQFTAVLEGVKTADVAAEIQRDHLPMTAVADPDGAIARRCGVYSTPQAVVLEPGGKLFYRGNYNSSRYCTERSTEFARLALDSLLSSGVSRPMPRAAVTAYGCQLPSNPALPVVPNGGFAQFCTRKISLIEGKLR